MKAKHIKKLTPEQVQELLTMRRRGFVMPNGKAYKRRDKHKNRSLDER